MSEYYNPNRTKNIYDPKSKEAFRLSRSKIENFIDCPKCFCLDRRLGVSQPPGGERGGVKRLDAFFVLKWYN